MIKNLLLALVAICCVSCATQTELYNWKKYDDAIYAYTKHSDPKSIESLMAVYDNLIRNCSGSRKVPPPGVCADYGYLLIQAGKVDQGRELLAQEIALYPESTIFIGRILKKLE